MAEGGFDGFEMGEFGDDNGYQTMEDDRLVDESHRLEDALDPLSYDSIIDDYSKVWEYESRLSVLRPILESRGLIGETDFIDDNRGGVTIANDNASLNVRSIADDSGKGMSILMKTKLSDLN